MEIRIQTIHQIFVSIFSPSRSFQYISYIIQFFWVIYHLKKNCVFFFFYFVYCHVLVKLFFYLILSSLYIARQNSRFLCKFFFR